MWQIQLPSSGDRGFLSDYVHESVDSILRKIIVAFSGMYASVLLLTMIRWPAEFNWRLLPIALVVILTAILSYWLIQKQFILSQAIWQIGMAAAVCHTTLVFGRPEVLFLLAFLPMIMILALGWLPALAAEAFVIALVAAFTRLSLSTVVPLEYIVEVGTGGFLGGVLGWAFGSALFGVAKWSLSSYRDAQSNLEEMRIHRGHLARLTKDLDQAYYRLERANAALTMAWRKADEAERLKSEFVVNVSHELRTPLNLIIGFSEVISRSPESYRGATLPSAYRRDINAIYNSAKHLLSLIDDVLDLGRIDAGKTILVRNEVAPADLVDEVVDMVRDYIRAKGLALHVTVEKNLPILWIDSLRIRQALLNVLANAVRYTAEGTIRLEVVRREADIQFRITDSGPGISEADLPHVFDLFHSAEQPPDTKWHSGTGLGLPLSKKFVEMHGGTMGVESILGKGATFWFSLPSSVHKKSLTQTLTTPLPQSPDIKPQPEERTVVVVNADAAVVSLLQHYLDTFRFYGADTMEEGLALAENIHAAAIIADPEISRSLRQSRIPIIHFPWPTSQQAAASLGARGFLTKPVSTQQLQASIEDLGYPIRRILIADSDPELVRLFQRMLRAHVPIQNCLEAYNIEEVLQRAVTEHPDLIMMEFSMLKGEEGGPVKTISDFSALREIPVILISETNWEELRLKLSGPIQANRPEGFDLREIVRAAEALVNALSPAWNMEPKHSEAPSG